MKCCQFFHCLSLSAVDRTGKCLNYDETGDYTSGKQGGVNDKDFLIGSTFPLHSHLCYLKKEQNLFRTSVLFSAAYFRKIETHVNFEANSCGQVNVNALLSLW